MSRRSRKRVTKALKARQDDFDSIPLERKRSMNRPGSLNPKKTHGRPKGRK
jgi:hypothetical protein